VAVRDLAGRKVGLQAAEWKATGRGVESYRPRSRTLAETLIVRTFYDTYAKSIREQIAGGGIDLGAFATYEQAIKPTDTGYHFDVYNARDDPLNQCQTYFDVSFSTTSQGISIVISGFVYWYKERKKHVTVLGKSETARAWAGGEMTWTANIPVTLLGSDDSRPRLKVAKPELVPGTSRTWHDANGVAKQLHHVSDLVGDVVKVGGILSLFNTNDWLLVGVFALHFLEFPTLPTVKGIALNLALEALSKSMSTTIILPAGQVFSAKQLSVASPTTRCC
jgi:hypothetical protein